MIALLLSLVAASSAPAASDFAWTASVPTTAAGGLQWVVWTDSVYILSRLDDNGDVALFSGEGNLLPWSEPVVQARGTRQLELPLRRLPAPARKPSRKDTVAVPDRWLAQVPDSLRGLWPTGARLEFESDKRSSFLGDVVLETSSDLANWARAGGGGICQVGAGEGGILRDSVSLQGPLAKYLRVSVVSNAPLAFGGLRISTSSDSVFAAAHRRSREVEGSAMSGAWDYDLGGDFPVDQLSLDVGPQSVLDARILAHASQDTNWVEIVRSSFFQVDFQGHRLQTPPVALSGRPYRYWKIDPVSTTLSRPPRLRAEWTPRRRLFLASPGQSVILAVGSQRLQSGDPGLSEDLFSAMVSDSGQSLAKVFEVAPAGFHRAGTGLPDSASGSGRWVLAALVAAALSTLWFGWKVWKESKSGATHR
jgi:hypothetical protein